MTTADVLRTAKALIDTPEEWAHPRNEHGSHCSSTAISEADPDWDHDHDEARYVFASVVGVESDNRSNVMGGIYRWNDAPERTHADVMAAFDKAIALAEQA